MTATTIHASFPTTAVTAEAAPSGGSRTISGLAVPWGVPGVVASGDTVVFHEGSLDASARPVALRDHDRTRPIGRVTAAAESRQGLSATVTVSRVSAGDEALVLAADGALGQFSVGANPTTFDYDADGTLHVHAADWIELSLLTIGAYPDAAVATVTAQGATAMPVDITTATDVPEEEREEQETPPEEEDEEREDTETSATVVPIAAAAGRLAAVPVRRHPYAAVGIRDLSQMIAAAAGDPRLAQRVGQIMASPGTRVAAPTVEAALTDITMVGTNNIGSMYRPGYQAELVEIVSHGSPAVDAIRQGDLQRGDYPNVSFNRWELAPVVGEQVAEKDEIPTSPAKITPSSAPVKTFATGNDVSQQVLDFGSPSFVEDWIRAAGVDYAQVIDTYALTGLLAVATPVTSVAGASLTDILAGLIGGLNPAAVPAGGLFALVSWDIGVGAMGATNDDRPAFWDGSISFGSFIPSVTMGGLSIAVDPNMPTGTALLGLRNAATWYDLPGTPFSLRAVNVGLLGLDIAVYGYGALGIQFPAALTKTTVPPV